MYSGKRIRWSVSKSRICFDLYGYRIHSSLKIYMALYELLSTTNQTETVNKFKNEIALLHVYRVIFFDSGRNRWECMESGNSERVDIYIN